MGNADIDISPPLARTQNDMMVFDVLGAANGPLSAYDILEHRIIKPYGIRGESDQSSSCRPRNRQQARQQRPHIPQGIAQAFTWSPRLLGVCVDPMTRCFPNSQSFFGPVERTALGIGST